MLMSCSVKVQAWCVCPEERVPDIIACMPSILPFTFSSFTRPITCEVSEGTTNEFKWRKATIVTEFLIKEATKNLEGTLVVSSF